MDYINILNYPKSDDDIKYYYKRSVKETVKKIFFI